MILPSPRGGATGPTPELDVGARLSSGVREPQVDASRLWGLTNYAEYVAQDAHVHVDAKDNFVPPVASGRCIAWRPNIELGANYTLQMHDPREGRRRRQNGPDVTLNGAPVVVLPPKRRDARCATGGGQAQSSRAASTSRCR